MKKIKKEIEVFEFKELDKEIQEKQLKEKIYNMNDELAEFGYNSLEYYLNADDEAKEALQNYTFLKNGTIYEIKQYI